jgi:hypothetical protein
MGRLLTLSISAFGYPITNISSKTINFSHSSLLGIVDDEIDV